MSKWKLYENGTILIGLIDLATLSSFSEKTSIETVYASIQTNGIAKWELAFVDDFYGLIKKNWDVVEQKDAYHYELQTYEKENI